MDEDINIDIFRAAGYMIKKEFVDTINNSLNKRIL